MHFLQKERYHMNDLVDIVSLLRSENGCPWDKEQTHTSMRQNFIEEVYEVVEAIDAHDPDMLREELGDVLLQVVMHSQMESEKNVFTVDDVANDICVKLIERHPHVFGSTEVSSTADALDNWEAIKQEQKNMKQGYETLEAVPVVLPALMRAQKVGKRAGKLGFSYKDTASAMVDLESELLELKEAIDIGDKENIAEELGDLLFSCANIARFVGEDSEKCLSFSTDKFISRVKDVELLAQTEGLNLKDLDDEKRDEFWNIIKNK